MEGLAERLGGPLEAHRAATEEEYRRVAGRWLAKQKASSIYDGAGAQPVAYINQGRWLCDCPCGNGPSTHPSLPIAICFECGALWRPAFPNRTAVQNIEAVLLARPVVARNYDPRRETIPHIRWENEHRGVV